MRFWKFVLPAAVGLACVASVDNAFAQRNRNNNNQSASVVVLNFQRVLAESTAGRSMATGLNAVRQQIATEAQALAPEEQAIAQEQQRLEAATRNQTAEQRRNNPQVQAFAQRVQAFQQRGQALQGDLECTQLIAMREFERQVTPVVRSVMEARGAGVVLDASSVQLAQPQFDITNDVLTQANQSVTTIAVTRRPLAECQQQQQQAPAPAPAQ